MLKRINLNTVIERVKQVYDGVYIYIYTAYMDAIISHLLHEAMGI